jgi:hypothetical protein
MHPTYTQIRSNIETFQDDRITSYSDDIERMESSMNSNVNDYNMTASEERISFSDSQDYNVQAPDYQQSHSYIDDSHLRVNPALNVNDYNVTASEEQTSFYNVQAPVYQRQSHSYIDDSHLRVNPTLNANDSIEQIGDGNHRDYNMQAPAYQHSHSPHYNTEKVNLTLNMNDTEQIGNGNYQDYNVQTPLCQYANNPHFSIRMDDALNANGCNTIIVEQTSHDNYQDYIVQAPTHQMSQLYVEDNTADRQVFFFKPINDVYVYKVECEETSFDIVIKMFNKSLINKENIQINENEIIFFYANQFTNRSYKITCKIVSPFSIVKYLNKYIYGIEIQLNVEQELLLVFTSEQKQNLEFHLSQYLNNYLLI